MKIIKIADLKLAWKISLGSAIIVFLAIFSGTYSLITLKSSRAIDYQVSEGYYPLISILKEFDELTRNTRYLTTSWMYLPNPEQKEELTIIYQEAYPDLRNRLNMKIDEWPDGEKDTLRSYIDQYDETVSDQNELMTKLNSDEAYSDEFLLFELIPLLDDGITRPLDQLHKNLLKEIVLLEEETKSLTEEKYASFDAVEWVIITLTLAALILGAITNYFTTKSIVRPIKTLKLMIDDLSIGRLISRHIKSANDEVGEMVKSVVSLQEGLRDTAAFAEQIGQGNLGSDFEPLSGEDVLGHSLISMRDSLQSVIEEVNGAVSMASEAGNLNARIGLENKEAAWMRLAASINELLESIAEPFRRVNTIINAMANGDLSTRYGDGARGDILLLAQNLDKALDNVSDLMHRISVGSEEVKSSSNEMLSVSEEMKLNTREIASSIAEMSNGAQNQVMKVDQASKVVEEIMTSSKGMGDQADNINEAARNGASNSEKGLNRIQKVASAMQDISSISSDTYKSIQVLTKRSAEISKVLSVITDIATQTNLLALNAAIEAAQAGDAGRGFAVVAEEIRKLAENSRESAKQIEVLIKDVQTDVRVTTQSIERMKESVNTGEEASSEASNAFSQITTSSAQTLEISEEIRQNVQKQIEDIRNIVSITESVVVIAEETAAGSEEIASSASQLSAGMDNYAAKSERLTEVADELSSSVNKFELD